MLDYKIVGNKILINNNFQEFDPKNILECGQYFRYFLLNNGSYLVVSGNNEAVIKATENGYEIVSSNPEYFEQFFNLKVDYSLINLQIKKLSGLEEIVDFSKGLRVIKSDIFETIVSFVISANNNIKRIKLILNRLCEKVGTLMQNGYYSFPSLEEFCKLDEAFFVGIGAGYRAKYLHNLTKQLPVFLAQNFDELSTEGLKKELIKLSGVGPKVADCISLFAFNRYDSFPVDVWIERAYYLFLCDDCKEEENKISRANISAKLTKKFGNLSGYLQQYLYNYMINN